MYRRFAFEGEVHDTLALIPLVIRRKLDLTATKLSLAGWQALSREERLALCHLPVDTDADLAVYREVLAGFAQRAGAPLDALHGPAPSPPDWSAPAVLARLRDKLGDAAPAEPAVAALGEEERYALFKLAEPRRPLDRLQLALAELGLGA